MTSMSRKATVFFPVLLMLIITPIAAQNSSKVITSFGKIAYSGMPDLLYSTDFEDAVKTGPNNLNLPVVHYFSLGGGGDFWVEDVNDPTPYAPTPRSGEKCIGLSTPAVTGTVRSEFELTELDTWEGLGDELFVSVWLYLPTNWGLHLPGWNWYELINTFVCWQGSGGGYPRTCLHIEKPTSTSPYQLVFKHYTQIGVFTQLGIISNFQVPLGEWFNLKYYVYRHETNGILKIWLSTSYYGNNYLLADVSGYQTKYPGQTDWFTVVGKIYLSGDGYEHKLWIDDVEIWNGEPPAS